MRDNGSTAAVRVMISWLGAWTATYSSGYMDCFNTVINQCVEEANENVVPSDVDIKACQLGLAAVRHTYWFQDKNVPTNVRSCLRIMKDFKRRNVEWQALSPWVRKSLLFCNLYRHWRFWLKRRLD